MFTLHCKHVYYVPNECTDIILDIYNHSLVQLTPSKLLTQLQEYSSGWDPIIQTPLFIQGVSASHILVRVHSEQVGSEAWPGSHVRLQTIENRKSNQCCFEWQNHESDSTIAVFPPKGGNMSLPHPLIFKFILKNKCI